MVAALLFVVCSVPLAFAASGAGNGSCATWVENRKTNNEWHETEQWVEGYQAGTADSMSIDLKNSGSDVILVWLDNYCQANPVDSVLDAARELGSSTGVRISGPGNTEGRLSDHSEMNRICRESYPNHTGGAFPVRWATTTDFREYNTSKGWDNQMPQLEEQVALRAENTVFTADGRSYDQATGALSPAGQPLYPGAVIMSKSNSRFAGKRGQVKPLCVHGTPNTELR